MMPEQYNRQITFELTHSAMAADYLDDPAWDDNPLKLCEFVKRMKRKDRYRGTRAAIEGVLKSLEDCPANSGSFGGEPGETRSVRVAIKNLRKALSQ